MKEKFLFWFSKPWVLIATALVIVGLGALLSVNRIMIAVLHSRPEVVVPNLEGKSLNHALNVVSSLNLALKQEGTEFDENLPAGTVIRQTPPAGMQVRTERAIRVVVSRGGQSVFIPDVVGKKLAEAQSMLAVEGLQVGAINDVYSASVEDRGVISQTPSSGTIVTRGTLVDLDVSKGLPPAGAPLIPDFVGQTLENVREWCTDSNVKYKVKEDSRAVGVAGTVVRQDPPPGQPLLDGDELQIVLVPFVGADRGARLSYKMPAAAGLLRIMARDNRGETEIYKGQHKGGEAVEIPITVAATTRVRIYVDDILQEERVLEP